MMYCVSGAQKMLVNKYIIKCTEKNKSCLAFVICCGPTYVFEATDLVSELILIVLTCCKPADPASAIFSAEPSCSEQTQAIRDDGG